MPNALLTGVSGLLAHQRMLEVVGHNIANTNTTGFKSQRALFADLMYETIRPATSAGGEGGIGGSNPLQVGQGVKVAQTDRKFAQGSLDNTGEEFDLALEGGGFFVVDDGVSEFYTRAGAFTLDEQGILTAPGGLHVTRFPGVGEPDGVNPAFQVPGDSRLRIPLGATVPGVATSEVTLTGNLSARMNEPRPTTMTAVDAFRVAGAKADGSTLLNDLDSSTLPYTAGDFVELSGTATDGTLVAASFAVNAATTVQDLVDFIDSSFTDASTQLIDGTLVMTADAAGPSTFTMKLTDNSNNGGQNNFTLQQLKETVEGQWSDVYPRNVTVYDVRGGAHDVDLLFTKTGDDIWQLTASMSSADGIVTDGIVEEIEFTDDGTFRSSSEPRMTFQFAGIDVPQIVSFEFQGQTSSDQLTHLEEDATVETAQDGSAPGTLVSVNFDNDGRVQGIASNGQVFQLAQLAVASFANPKGLVAVGNSLFRRTLNSGDPDIGLAAGGGRGSIRGGALEGSNVDLALEFTKLIVAQRGFSANARTITVSDEVLEELTNIIR